MEQLPVSDTRSVWTTANEFAFINNLGFHSTTHRFDRIFLLANYIKCPRYDWGGIDKKRVIVYAQRLLDTLLKEKIFGEEKMKNTS